MPSDWHDPTSRHQSHRDANRTDPLCGGRWSTYPHRWRRQSSRRFEVVRAVPRRWRSLRKEWPQAAISGHSIKTRVRISSESLSLPSDALVSMHCLLVDSAVDQRRRRRSLHCLVRAEPNRRFHEPSDQPPSQSPEFCSHQPFQPPLTQPHLMGGL